MHKFGAKIRKVFKSQHISGKISYIFWRAGGILQEFCLGVTGVTDDRGICGGEGVGVGVLEVGSLGVWEFGR